MKRGGIIIAAGIVALVAAAVIAEPSFAQASQGLDGALNVARGEGQPTQLFNGDGSIVGRVITLLLFVVGVLSIIMLIIGGLRFVLSGGNKEKATAARNTILYAIIGLLVAFFSYAIINFVVQAISEGSFGGSGGGSGYRGIW